MFSVRQDKTQTEQGRLGVLWIVGMAVVVGSVLAAVATARAYKEMGQIKASALAKLEALKLAIVVQDQDGLGVICRHDEYEEGLQMKKLAPRPFDSISDTTFLVKQPFVFRLSEKVKRDLRVQGEKKSFDEIIGRQLESAIRRAGITPRELGTLSADKIGDKLILRVDTIKVPQVTSQSRFSLNNINLFLAADRPANMGPRERERWQKNLLGEPISDAAKAAATARTLRLAAPAAPSAPEKAPQADPPDLPTKTDPDLTTEPKPEASSGDVVH